MDVLIQHLGGVRFQASARGHSVTCDQPLDNGGTDAGMTPPEFLLASLGTCAGFYAAQYLKVRSIPFESLSVRVEAIKSPNPARLSKFLIEVQIPGLGAQHEDGVLRAVKTCLIHNTLLRGPAIEAVVNTGSQPRSEAA